MWFVRSRVDIIIIWVQISDQNYYRVIRYYMCIVDKTNTRLANVKTKYILFTPVIKLFNGTDRLKKIQTLL